MYEFAKTGNGQRFLKDVSKIANALERLANNTVVKDEKSKQSVDVTAMMDSFSEKGFFITTSTEHMASVVEFLILHDQKVTIEPMPWADEPKYKITSKF